MKNGIKTLAIWLIIGVVLIVVISSILENNKTQNNYKEIIKKQSKMVFSANLIPNISIQDYLIRIQT